MINVGAVATEVLVEAGVELGNGLTDAEFESVRTRFGFSFNPDHRDLLATALPLGNIGRTGAAVTTQTFRECSIGLPTDSSSTR